MNTQRFEMNTCDRCDQHYVNCITCTTCNCDLCETCYYSDEHRGLCEQTCPQCRETYLNYHGCPGFPEGESP